MKKCKCLMILIKGRKSRDAQKSGLSFLPEYKIWSGIRTRCNPKTIRGSKDYSGVRMSFEWAASFERFMRDMGRRPDKRFSIDRKDNFHGYCKHNCRWATAREQVLNRRNTKNPDMPAGVYRRPNGTFSARITLLGREFHLGTFDSEKRAGDEYGKFKSYFNPPDTELL